MRPLTMHLFIYYAFLFFVELTSASSDIESFRIPKWLSHIDEQIMRKHSKIAEQRHEEAVKVALNHYPTDILKLSQDSLKENGDFLKGLKFHKFRIRASGSLPDYHDELGDAPVFVTRRETPLFSRKECAEVIRMAEAYYEGEIWPKLPSGQYYIQGFWIKDVPSVSEWFTKMCKARLFPLLKLQFPDFVDDIEDLVVDQAYLFKYKAEPGLRTEIHTDAGCLSFTFALNSIDDYEGGGTWVEGLECINNEDNSFQGGDIIEMDAGQCTVRPGGIRHCGNPLRKGTRYIIGGFCMSKKRVETVRQLLATSDNKEGLEVAIKLNPTFDGVYPSVAHHYENEGDTKKAIQVLEDCLQIANPMSSTASYYLGTIYYNQHQYEKAKECMKTCLKVDPSDGDAMGTLAQIMAQLGNPEEEYKLYQTIVSTPGVSKRILSNAFCNLGTMQESDTNKEMDFYKKALEFEPNNVAALQSIGSVYASLKDWQNAIIFYQKVLELDGENREVLTLLYRCATQQLRTEASPEQQSRESMMARLSEIMGKSYMDQLLAANSR